MDNGWTRVWEKGPAFHELKLFQREVLPLATVDLQQAKRCDLQRVFGGGFTASSALRRLKAPSARGGRNEHAGAQERGSACMQ